jgi:CheY-like chemotaxis protein
VDQDKFNRLFKTFSQVHEEGSVKESGTGLGLYISYEIVQQLGGWIEVHSKAGKWSLFTITLGDVKIFEGEDKQKENVRYKFFGETLLLADDAPINITLLESYLSPHHLKIETAKNGEELFEKAINLKPSLIITDFKMPLLNGHEALIKLKKNNINIPMILVSALKIEDDIRNEFQGFLQKPVEEEVFLEEIAKFLKHERET